MRATVRASSGQPTEEEEEEEEEALCQSLTSRCLPNIVPLSLRPYCLLLNGSAAINSSSSPAGLYGLMYTTPYSAAKAALIGFSNALTLEGTQYGIASNTIAPYAATRMTTPGANRKNADPGKAARYAATLAMMDPGHVSALVAFLCHQDCKEEGGVFEAGAGWFAKVRTQRASGAFLPGPPAADLLERLRDEWSKVTDFDGAQEVGPGTVKTGFEPVSMMKLQGKL